MSSESGNVVYKIMRCCYFRIPESLAHIHMVNFISPCLEVQFMS